MAAGEIIHGQGSAPFEEAVRAGFDFSLKIQNFDF